MSEAAETIRAIDAISITLSERMALILRALPDIERKGPRYVAYQAGGIRLADYRIDETDAADLAAFDFEKSRRRNVLLSTASHRFTTDAGT